MDNLEWDVIVAGGGMSGFVAATAAARNGARTLLVERDACLGGTMTTGLVGPMMTFHSARGQVIGGLAQEVVDRLVALHASPGHIFDASGYVHSITPFDGEALKLVAQRMLLESGAQLLLHSPIVDVICRDGGVQGVVVQHKGGRQALRAGVVIDASGDGDVAAWAGAEVETGRSADGLTQPMSLMFKMIDVDVAQLRAYLQAHPEVARLSPQGAAVYAQQKLTAVCAFGDVLQESIAAGELPLRREHVLVFSTAYEDEVTVNMSRVARLSPLDGWSLTQAEIQGREQIFAIARFLQRRIPGFAAARLAASGGRIGIRESRRVVGEYVLDATDILAGRRFADAIARSAYPIDVHAPDPGENHLDRFLMGGEYYEIPYRCLLPGGLDGLLVSGRCISTTHEAHGATRVSPSCMAFGQAAGTAAALAVRSQVQPRDLDAGMLRRVLIDQGALLA